MAFANEKNDEADGKKGHETALHHVILNEHHWVERFFRLHRLRSSLSIFVLLDLFGSVGAVFSLSYLLRFLLLQDVDAKFLIITCCFVSDSNF